MIKIDVIRHGDCSDTQKKMICEFKNLNWIYPIDSHLNWMEENLDIEDLHVLLYDKGKLCAYLNLVDTKLYIDNGYQPIWGIGNVCVDPEYKGLGYGHLIMDVAKFYCKKSIRIGVLFCQGKNTGFYRNCNWVEYKGKIIGATHDIQHINTFTTQRISSKIITVIRDF